MTKRYRVANRFRFTLFVVLSLVLITTVFNFASGFNTAVSLSETDQYVEVPVRSGDTLWEIATEHMPANIDTREAVYRLCKINGLSADDLTVGTVIKVPIYH